MTLTTVGYGDILPRSSAARTMAVLEAVMGQIYLMVLVARLVGLHIVHATGLHSDKDWTRATVGQPHLWVRLGQGT